jgi:hypothetical protein
MGSKIIDDFLGVGAGAGGKDSQVYHCPKLRSLRCIAGGEGRKDWDKTKAPLEKGAGLYDPKICDIMLKHNV